MIMIVEEKTIIVTIKITTNTLPRIIEINKIVIIIKRR